MKNILSKFIDRRSAEYQNELLASHYEEIQNIYAQIRGWRHDYHNHIQLMKAYLAQENYSKLESYLSELDRDLTSIDAIIKSGNIMLDAILNSKLSLATAKNIRINTKATAPKNLPLSDIGLCIIVGNLLNNAIEACVQIKDEKARFIRVYIGIFKEQLYISVSNSTAKNAKKHYVSTKKDGGFGLLRIDGVVKKYGGYVSRQSEEGVFATEIMLPM